jgi:parvulin-like peptidyl-prolyl isomerase
MTFRAKPVVRRTGRSGWGSGDRRTTLINFGFVGAIALAVLILVGYTAWSWYEDHFGVAATVDGQVITRDDLRTRIAIEDFRIDYVLSRVRTLMASGRITAEDGAAQIQFLEQRRQSIASLSLERLVDTTLMARLATEAGVSASEADIDAQLVEEATTNEQRHVWMIEVEPEVDEETGQVEDEERAAARARAEAAVAELRAGEPWEDVAREVSDAANAPQAGDLGWMTVESGYDEAFMEAVFALEVNVPTDVVEGEDGVFRIGRVTEIGPEDVDPNYELQITEAGLKLEDYRAAVRGDVVREKLSEKVVADLSQPGPQRHVLQLYLPEPNASQLGEEAGVKVRHILYAPKDDPDGADDLPEDDPAWEAAKAEADAAYAELSDDPDDFDARARAESDEPTAKETGGKQPWYYASSPLDTAFKNAIFAADLEPGQVLQPVRTSFGWHVIQFMRPSGDGDEAWAESLKGLLAEGADFEQLAMDHGEGEEAAEGGDIGWIARGQLDEELDSAIFDTAVGQVSEVVPVFGDGVYLFKVLAEETREPTDEQKAIFEQTGFGYWYTQKKEAADITYNLGAAV